MRTRINRYNTTCVLVGYYDKEGMYCEEIFENVELKKMDKSITRNVYLNHDITIHVVPGVEIRVFSKSLKDIDAYFEIEEDPNCFRIILDCFSEHNKSSNGEYIYTTFELEERRRAKELPPIEF